MDETIKYLTIYNAAKDIPELKPLCDFLFKRLLDFQMFVLAQKAKPIAVTGGGMAEGVNEKPLILNSI